MSQYNENFRKNGVILVKNLIDKKLTNDLSYCIENLYQKHIKTSIPDKPMMVCWRHQKNGKKSIFPLSLLSDFKLIIKNTKILNILKK